MEKDENDDRPIKGMSGTDPTSSEDSSPNLSGSESTVGFNNLLSEYMALSANAQMIIPTFQPYRINEITPGHEWPRVLKDLINRPTGGVQEVKRKIPITEISALLCHAAFIEVGFVPIHCDLDALTVCTMRDPDRIEKFGKEVDASGYNSTAGVFTWAYRVVNLITDENGTAKGDGESVDNDEEMNCSLKYVFSKPCSLIVIPNGPKAQVFCNFPGSEDLKPFQLNLQLDLQPYVETSLELTGKKTPEEWMKCLNFNGTKFSSCIKSTFATPCLDSLSGVMFDMRGLVCLPPEVLVQVFSYSDLSSIRNARLTCKYLDEVASIPSLWRTLIRRDFGKNPTVPAARFARFLSRVPFELSPNLQDAPRDYRSIYEAHRRHSFRGRIDGFGGFANRLGPRHSWLHYVTPPRPYLFRVAYDVPQLPSVHGPNRYFPL